MRRSPTLLAVLTCLLLAPSGARAQAGVAVLGRLSDADSEASVQNAIVTVVGVGSTLTTQDGTFRFRGVLPGEYTLRVEAFGYADLSVPLSLASDTTLTLAVRPAPLGLDSITVAAGSLDFEGRVRDQARDFWVVDAQILTDRREPVWTDAHGRFDLNDVAEEAPLHLTIRAFGYLPIDTTFVPDDDRRYDFDLIRDAFAEALIGTQVRRLEERAGGRAMAGFGSMDRAEILRYSGAHTARTMLDFDVPQRIRDRITCIFLDEQLLNVSLTMGMEVADAVLGQTLPEEIERVELLVFDAVQGRPLMLQIYTRSFIRTMSAQNLALRAPMITPTGTCL